MRRIVFIALLSAFIVENYTPLYGQDPTIDFNALSESFNQSFDDFVSQSADEIESVEAEYDALWAEIVVEYDEFKSEVQDIWGDTTATVSDRYRWVEYGEDRLSRSVVDFESGEVEIELLLTDEEVSNDSLVALKLSNAMDKLVSSKGSSVEYDSKYIPKESVSSTPIMDDIFDIRSGNITRESLSRADNSVVLSQTELENISLEQEVEDLRSGVAALTPATPSPSSSSTSSTTPTTTTPKPSVKTEVSKVQTSDGERNVVTVKTSLNVGYVGELASRYKSEILANAERFNISPTLIFAIMETESYFNPTAKSHVPAYGLMQIVPKYAGRDAYKSLYGVDKILSASYLYQSSQNIEIGVVYLSILANNYFKGVTELKNRELCMIAAYNTGAGNVSKALVGHTNVFKAISTINSMSYDALYAHLRKNLPYEETRSYIEKVTTKRTKYMAK